MVPRNFFQLHGSTWGHSSSSYTYRTYNRKCYVARHRFNCFAYINAFNSYTNPVEEININTSILKLRKLRHTQPATEGHRSDFHYWHQRAGQERPSHRERQELQKHGRGGEEHRRRKENGTLTIMHFAV